MRLAFTKMQGAGNDFVVLDATREPAPLDAAGYRALADRRYGIGCDQILVVESARSADADFRYRVFNAGGEEVEHCGNGARCLARFVRERGLTTKNRIRVETVNRRLELVVGEDGRVRVDMNRPIFDAASVPFDAHALVPRQIDGFALWPLVLGPAAGAALAVPRPGAPPAARPVGGRIRSTRIGGIQGAGEPVTGERCDSERSDSEGSASKWPDSEVSDSERSASERFDSERSASERPDSEQSAGEPSHSERSGDGRIGGGSRDVASFEGAPVEVAVLSMGNPHAVLFVADVDAVPVGVLGPLIERHARFPQRVNAGFAQVVGRDRLRLRVYERGAGETLACGTGACAAVVAGIRLGRLDAAVEVEARGGPLRVDWAGGAAPVYLSGPAETVFRGEIEL